ncbi:helix-turn-helix transcriptional regulator [Halostella pelagica]|uniref:helix-turn-helix transcriptional regulator n=1 Tax=Halostella pelagica TaxID=2583824 RepID=UPI0010822E82|nr:MarR family transcriptional regulator [Halostella pelagica]
MNYRPLRNIHLLAAVTFVTAILVLAIQLITPSPVMVSLGESGTQTTSVGQYFTYNDVAVVVVASLLCGASGTYLVLHDRAQRLVNHEATGQQNVRPQPEANGGVETSDGGVDTYPEETGLPREQWEETAERLQNNQETIYTELIEADGELAQRKLVEETDLSKATVSRTLDKLENRGLVERKRNGMGNTIQLK